MTILRIVTGKNWNQINAVKQHLKDTQSESKRVEKFLKTWLYKLEHPR